MMNKVLFSRLYETQVMSTGKNQDMWSFFGPIHENYYRPRQVSFVDLAPYGSNARFDTFANCYNTLGFPS